MSPTFEFVQTELVDRVGWLRFARPPVNAVTRAMAEETREAIRWLAGAPEVRVGVLGTAVEKYFSAGADLEAFVGIGGEGMRDWVAMTHEMAILLREAPKPLLAAIRGTAVGGGLEIALHCDLRFAARGARFGQPEINIAFIPPIATTQALVRLIGRPASLRYLYEGRVHDAETALAMGLVDELVADADLEAHVQAHAVGLAAKPRRALEAIRRTVTLGGGASFAEGMALERDEAVALAEDPDFDEGVAAFLAKRKPVWRG